MSWVCLYGFRLDRELQLLQTNNPEFIFGPFKWVQLFKWIVGIMTLVALAFTDILLFRNWRGVLWGILAFTDYWASFKIFRTL
jgi:hypothetical protein